MQNKEDWERVSLENDDTQIGVTVLIEREMWMKMLRNLRKNSHVRAKMRQNVMLVERIILKACFHVANAFLSRLGLISYSL